MIAVAPPTTTSTAKIASRTLRVVLLGGGSSAGGPKVGGGPPGGGWVGEEGSLTLRGVHEFELPRGYAPEVVDVLSQIPRN